MARRLQTINDDTVLEITENQPVKRRLSEKRLLQQKTYLERSIARFQAQLDEVNASLALISNERDAKGKK